MKTETTEAKTEAKAFHAFLQPAIEMSELGWGTEDTISAYLATAALIAQKAKMPLEHFEGMLNGTLEAMKGDINED